MRGCGRAAAAAAGEHAEARARSAGAGATRAVGSGRRYIRDAVQYLHLVAV
jgi:hypothetical protein